jgi:predicted extracellular nuclease
MMKLTLQKPGTYALLVLTLLAGSFNALFAQTNPPAQSLPFSFTSVSGSTLPDGVAVHRFGTTAASIPTSRTTAPAIADLPYNATVNSGGWLGANNGADGIAMLASGSNAAGAVVIAINTIGKTNILVNWTGRTVLQQASRDHSLALQYRIGTSGDFINLGDASQVYTSADKAVGDFASFSLILPPALENQSLVQLRWIYWESAGTAGSRDRIALDDVSIGGATVPDTNPPVVSTLTPSDNAVNVPLTASLMIDFSKNVVKGTGNIIVTNTTDNTSQTIDVTSTDITVSNDLVTISNVNFENSQSYYVTISAGAFTDDENRPFAGITALDAWNFTTAAPVGTATRISIIQGSGATAALTGEQTIEGIVTRTFIGANGLSGFFVQEEDADADSDPTTSEAIFVYNVAADAVGLVTPNQGDKVNITGTVVDFVSTLSGVTTSLTEMKTLIRYVNMGASALPAVTSVKLPVASVSDLERYEGMLVDVSATAGNLTVTEYFEIGRYGQVVLAADGASNQAGTDARLDQYTQFNAPSTTGYAAYQAELAKRTIILDDGSTRQNPETIIFGRGGNPLSATNTLRGGDQVINIVGILDERLEGYRIQTATGVNFIAANTRPVTPPSVNSASGTVATLKVASANVLNYFTSLDLNASGTDFRGANTAEEFTRQKTKVIKALIGTGADVIGLMELQRNGTTSIAAIQDLVAGLNTDPASSGTYDFVNTDPAVTGFSISTDAITVGMIYKKDKVSLVGNPATLTTSTAFDLVGRRPLAQTFRQISNNEVFTVVVNHFKSKGSSSGGAGDADARDGQGASNGTRSRQATDLTAWLATNPTGSNDPDYLILGDLNAYAMEQPLTILAAAGYVNQLPVTSYSYVFDGQIGSLDHALATSSLASQITGTAKWHINSDEPSVLDYNTEFKSAAQVNSLYAPDQFRASDHDPVLVGLNLANPLPVNLVTFEGKAIYDHDSRSKIRLQWETAGEVNNQGFDVLKSTTGSNFKKIGFVQGKATTTVRTSYTFDDADVLDGKTYYYQLKQIDADGTFELTRIIAVRMTLAGSGMHVYPNPSSGSFFLSGKNVTSSSARLYNMLGREIKITREETDVPGIYAIHPKESLSAGMYHLVLQSSNGNDKQTLNVVVR